MYRTEPFRRGISAVTELNILLRMIYKAFTFANKYLEQPCLISDGMNYMNLRPLCCSVKTVKICYFAFRDDDNLF